MCFVDVEQGINTAVRKVSAVPWRTMPTSRSTCQTVVGRGYRFVAPTAQEDVNGQTSSRKDFPFPPKSWTAPS